MDVELRKRLEERSEKIYLADNYKDDETICLNVGAITKRFRKCYIAGAEYGYKEAIAQAKEWLYSNIDLYGYTNDDDVTIIEYDALLAAFEADMNKIWDEYGHSDL